MATDLLTWMLTLIVRHTTHHKFDMSRTWKFCDSFQILVHQSYIKKPPDGCFSILMLLHYPLVEASYFYSWYILILFTYQLELGQLASLAASGSGDKSKDKLGEKVFKLYMLTEGIICYITYFSFYWVNCRHFVVWPKTVKRLGKAV